MLVKEAFGDNELISGVLPMRFGNLHYNETEMNKLSGCQPWYSMEMLKLAFSALCQGQSNQPDNL